MTIGRMANIRHKLTLKKSHKTRLKTCLKVRIFFFFFVCNIKQFFKLLFYFSGESSIRASELANNFLTNLTFTEAFSKLETSETTGDSKGKSELNKKVSRPLVYSFYNRAERGRKFIRRMRYALISCDIITPKYFFIYF